MMPRTFEVVEVKDAAPFVGYLFERVFAAKPPDFPRHFVCLLHEGDGRFRVAGYAHFSRFESVWLGGGLVVDKSIYASVTKEELAGCGPNGSIGEFTVAEGIRQLGDDDPVLAYIGDPRSIVVNLNAGYVETHIPKIYACWKRRFTPEVERAICERVNRIAPF
jgi:hypothetical protein